MRAVIAPERALAIQKLAATFKSDTARPLKVFQRMLGLMAAASPVLQLGLLRMRPLQRWLKPRVPHNAWRHGRLHIRVNQPPGRTHGGWRRAWPWGWSTPGKLSRQTPPTQVGGRCAKANRPSAIGRRRRAASTSTAWKCQQFLASFSCRT